jgi:hypothetical protein
VTSRMQPRRSLFVLLAVPAAMVLGAAAFLSAGPRPAADWRSLRAVAIESDDWGLPGFVPHAGALALSERDDLGTGSFPAVYWGSTLEDSLAVARLGAVLAAHRGHDGLPAVFQPNYVMGSLEWQPAAGGSWARHDLPTWPSQYPRPGMWAAVGHQMAAGVWYPELHARWHYDPVMRREKALATPLARKLTARGVMLFPGSEKARELGPWRSAEDLDRELGESREIFRKAFGRWPRSIIAPDYTWNGAMESIWEKHGMRVIQAKREQRNPDLGYGKVGRARKYLERKLEQYLHPDRVYLQRNVRLEPGQAPDPQAVVDLAVRHTFDAWERAQPAIVESHRVNFAHLDREVEETGRRSLDGYLVRITADTRRLPLFLTDQEIALLQVRGTSWVRRGEVLILRNATRSARVVAVPPGDLPLSLTRPGRADEPALFLVPRGRTVILGP